MVAIKEKLNPLKLISKYKTYFSYLSLHSFDDKTPEGRAKERYRLSALASLSGLLSNILGMVVLVITVPLTLSYLGEERFGVWMTIGSLAALLSFLDLGIGNGLVNRVAHARVDPDKEILPSVIAHGLIVLILVGVILGGILLYLVQYLPVARLIKVSNPSVVNETKDGILIFCLIFAASIPLGGLQKIFQGLQLSWIGSAVKGGGAVLSLLLVYYLANQQAGVPLLLLATYGVQNLVLLVLLYFLVKGKKLSFPRYDKNGFVRETKALLGVGSLFLVLQIGYLIGWSSDSLIVSSVLGVDEVTKLALMQRLFQFVFLPLSLINAPLWGAYADAHANGDRDFISLTLKKSLVRTAVLAAIGCLVFVLLSPLIFPVWLHSNVLIPFDLVAIYGIWIFVQCVFMPVSMFLNGLGVVKIQMVVVVAFCIVCLPLKIYFAEMFGVVGVVQAAIIAYVLTAVVPYTWVLLRGSLRSYLLS